MLRIFLSNMLFLSSLCLVNAQELNNKEKSSSGFNAIQIDTLFQDTISIRAIEMDNDKIWYAADKNRYGCFYLKSNTKFENKIIEGDLKIEFRSIASTANFVYVLSVANPALLYQISKTTNEAQLVYKEVNEKVFYDSMRFWNANNGIAVGDPIDGYLCVLKTNDGGKTWKKILNSGLPKLQEGEAHFAASNSIIVLKGNKVWIVSGGKKARVFYSPDKGNSWKVFDTPIVQGKQMTGIFTADFYDGYKGFIAGGDYEIPTKNSENKAVTSDGGKSWKLIADSQDFGYASCVQYVPDSNGNGVVVVGASGLYYSSDGGQNWVQFSKDSSLYTLRFIDSTTAIAAGRNKMIRIRFK